MSDVPKVLILAGGRGTRLSSVTNGKPKALVNINGIPFLELQLNWLENSGVSEVSILAGHGAKFISEYVAGRKSKKLNITVITEKSELGTGGAILNGVHEYIKAGEPFVVVNGDSMANINLRKFCALGEEKKNYLQIGVQKVDESGDYGFIECDQNQRITFFNEKSLKNKGGWVNIGIYYFPANFIDSTAQYPARFISLENHLIPQWLAEGRLMASYRIEGEFIDIGTPQRLMEFIKMNLTNGAMQ